MNVIPLSAVDLGLAAAGVLALALIAHLSRLGVTRPLLVAALRTAVQLSLVGVVLETLFSFAQWYWVALMALVMLLLAGREVMARQTRRFKGAWAFVLGTSSMFVSSFSVTVLALTLLVQARPWYEPQYAIPLLGMLLGNTMNGIALSLDRLTETAYRERGAIEARLMLGYRWQDAVEDIRRQSMRTGMIPMINAMAAAGVVSLPGMMTGQILAGSPPGEAVKYQILIMFLITVGAGFGTFVAVTLGARRLFDERERLRLDRLREGR